MSSTDYSTHRVVPHLLGGEECFFQTTIMIQISVATHFIECPTLGGGSSLGYLHTLQNSGSGLLIGDTQLPHGPLCWSYQSADWLPRGEYEHGHFCAFVA